MEQLLKLLGLLGKGIKGEGIGATKAAKQISSPHEHIQQAADSLDNIASHLNAVTEKTNNMNNYLKNFMDLYMDKPTSVPSGEGIASAIEEAAPKDTQNFSNGGLASLVGR